jgi:hypothetical protein
MIGIYYILKFFSVRSQLEFEKACFEAGEFGRLLPANVASDGWPPLGEEGLFS